MYSVASTRKPAPRATGVDDDLFDLGADSIHLFQITARANRDGLALTTKDLLRHRTIARICVAIASEATTENNPGPATVSGPIKPQLRSFARGKMTPPR